MTQKAKAKSKSKVNVKITYTKAPAPKKPTKAQLAKMKKRIDRLRARERALLDSVDTVPGDVEDALNEYSEAQGDACYPNAEILANLSEALALASSDLDEVIEELEEIEVEVETLEDEYTDWMEVLS